MVNITNKNEIQTNKPSFKRLCFTDYRPKSQLYKLKREIYELKSENPFYQFLSFLNREPHGVVRGGTTTVLYGEGLISESLMEQLCAKLQKKLNRLKAKQTNQRPLLCDIIEKIGKKLFGD